jgi:dipeptidyl aminopeptidase/acylaminoacyl peptidase
MRFERRLAPFVLVLAVAASGGLWPAGAAAPPPEAGPAAGHWEGAIEIPGSELVVKVDLQQVNGLWNGTIDFPSQSAKGLPLAAIAVDGDKVRFSIDKVPGSPTFDGTLGKGEIRGTFTQGGAAIPFHLGRDVVKPVVRPQDPKPPFPYVEREVGYANGAVHLAGTLTLPAGKGPFPAVLLITGSGPQNRNEEIFNHRPFWVIADHLTRAGIAVLRVDDRGVGSSTGAGPGDTTAEFATDVLAGVSFLATLPEIARDRIGLLGHSEGGVIAPMVASRSTDVAFIILLAGTGVPGDEVLMRQVERIARAGQAPEDRIAKTLALERQALDLLLHEKDEAVLRAKLRDNARAGLALLPDGERKALGSDSGAAIESLVRPALSAWFRYFISYDPRPALRQVHVPVLALNGDKDVQVAADQNLPEIEAALRQAKNPDVTVRRMPGLNHLFQAAGTGSPEEYGKIDETISPAVLDLITHWILDRFARPAPPESLPDPPQSSPHPLTLEQIMADPDWIGNAPEEPYWADDGQAVYYRRKQQGHELRDLYRLELASGKTRLIPFAEEGKVDVGGGALSHDRRNKVYVREGDVYVKDLGTGAIRQLTRTAQKASDASFMVGDRRVSFRAGDDLFVYDLDTGLVSQPADLRLKKDPVVAADEPDKDDAAEVLKQQQRRLFDAIREKRLKEKETRERDEAEQRDDPTRAPLPWYLGEKIKIEQRSLSPRGNWLLLVTVSKDAKEAKKAQMPNYVTESGYVEEREVRSKVGAAEPIPQSLLLLDLEHHKSYELALDELPGITVDPLKQLRDKEAAAKKAEHDKRVDKNNGKESDRDTDKDNDKNKDKGEDKEKKDKPKARPVTVAGIEWSEDGAHAAVELISLDYKDRWIVTLEPAGHRLAVRHHLSNAAWINWDYNELGWLRDNSTLYYLSEESGYSHLYLTSVVDGKTRALTSGKYEASRPQLSRDGRYLYYLANASHPGVHEVWRADVESGQTEQLTRGGGSNEFEVSPEGKQLLLLHSEIALPNELYLQDNRPGAAPRRLTETVSADFLAQDWTVPEIVPIPSTHVQGAIYSRVYSPRGAASASPAAGGRLPAVVFIHGAGYLQDAHYGWSYYFHEFMFHSLLVQHGYVVLDMDYRASAGYGRDWRTAIYRTMGHPELEDLEDGVAWLVAHRSVDPARVGVYGGSYGGFLTLMALFRRPELFACGAALRPVTDWAHYNEDYTGAILNSPGIDPEAYRTSSPIEFAAGLSRPLLMCAGMQDDNVFFQDDVRLVQRLIELKKENFNLALYPLEAHGFKAPVAWLDEYRRIFKLFETYLSPNR